MITQDAARTIGSVKQPTIDRYCQYMTDHVVPHTPEEQFQRWLFTYASVHTNWLNNCRMYYALKDLKWIGDDVELLKRLKESGAGCHNKRTEYIAEFTEFFWNHQAWFLKTPAESWEQYRKRLQAVAKGIGFAKSAFLVELLYPTEAELVCVDTHVLQLYGYKPSEQGNVRTSELYAMEDHWVRCSQQRGVPAPIARWIYWDRKQDQPDSRYWSFVLERENYHDRLVQIAGSER